jgi:myo-inositol-1(or 4)-monophosphatase
MISDLTHALAIARTASERAGALIRAGYDAPLSVQVKSDPSDRVTQVDKAAQREIARVLAEAFPGVPMIGEEDEVDDSIDPTGEYWVVDPIDGTSNFIQRLPDVGVSIGLRQNGESVLGVLHLPMHGHTYTAIKGGGAYRDGKPIRMQERSRLIDSTVAELFSDRVCRGREVAYPPCLSYRKIGSAVVAFGYLAQGSIDAVALQCRLWDIAAGEVIIREAGGQVRWSFDGENGLRGPLTFLAATPGIFAEFAKYALHEYSREKAQ